MLISKSIVLYSISNILLVIGIDFGLLLIAPIVVQHRVLEYVTSDLFVHLFRTVVQRNDGRTAIVLNHRECVFELDTVLGQFVVHVTAHVHRHRLVPGQQDARQVPRTGRFLGAVQKYGPRVLTVQHERVVNAFVQKITKWSSLN